MKKVVRIVEKGAAGFDAEYWSTKTSKQRLEALEVLRNQNLVKDGVRQRFQRVCRIVER